MSHKQLNIVSFDVPYPPSYGGVIDVFYKIKALQEAGVKITLHCFQYGRAESRVLEALCEKVYYYKRKFRKHFFFDPEPYIAVTRSSITLLKNIAANDYPVLFEGLHCCYFLSDKRLNNRIKLVRMHNIEHDYYSNLARVERRFLKRFYFHVEAKKLKRFESVLRHADHILAISAPDKAYLQERYPNVELLPAFHPNDRVTGQEGRGSFALYHGNLGVGENNEAALYLVNEVFNDLSFPFIIAGNNPSKALKDAVKQHRHIELRSGSTAEIDELIRSAQLHVLPTFQATGIKLKLLAALFNGRHCIVNGPMIADTGLESLCNICPDAASMKQAITGLFEKPFDRAEKEKRETVLLPLFSNQDNASMLIHRLG